MASAHPPGRGFAFDRREGRALGAGQPDLGRAGAKPLEQRFAADGVEMGGDLSEEEIAAIEAKEEEGIVGVTNAVNRTHRLKALGNGIVPLVAMPFALAIYRMLEEGY